VRLLERSNHWNDGTGLSAAVERWYGPQYPVDAFFPCLPSFFRLEYSAIVRDKMLPQAEGIEGSIFIIRSSRVMLSMHLAALYNVEPRALVQAVKRNRERFPGDFMFQLTAAEWENLKSQIVISSWGGSRRAAPYAFTEQGIAMLSSVLKSRRAIQVNIEIMRAFVRLRQLLASNTELARKMDALEKKYDAQFKVVFDAIRQLMTPPEPNKRKIGFLVKERATRYGRA
jgi:hypothetical protein